MTIDTQRAIRAAALPLLTALTIAMMISVTASAAPRRTSPRSALPKPVTVGAAILPVPLNPIVSLAQRQCSALSASGVGTRVLKPGSTAKPAASDVVLVNYIGYLATTGAVFDQNREASFAVGGVIKGFAEGLQTMGRGGITRICVPAALGYGPRGVGSIPANSNLVFQVELVDFKTAAEIEALQQAQVPAAAASPASQPTTSAGN